MGSEEMDAVPMIKGTLDLLILKTLSWGPLHGYGISQWITQRANGAFTVDDSAMYQALQRLEGRGLLSAGWGTTENNRRARYYKLTAAGNRQLALDAATWQRYTTSVSGILALAHREA